MQCVKQEEFWNLPNREICRKCFDESQIRQNEIQNLQTEIRRTAATLAEQIGRLSNTLGNTMIEDETQIEALRYFAELIRGMSSTRSSRRNSHPETNDYRKQLHIITYL